MFRTILIIIFSLSLFMGVIRVSCNTDKEPEEKKVEEPIDKVDIEWKKMIEEIKEASKESGYRAKILLIRMYRELKKNSNN